MPPSRLPWAMLLAGVLALQACGATPPGRPRARTTPPRPLATPIGLPPVDRVDRPEALDGPALVARVRAAFLALPGYRVDVAYMHKQGAKTAAGQYEIEGRPPATTRIEVVRGEGTGTRLLYQGGKTAKVRAAGLLGAIALPLPVTDGRLVSVRGYTLAQVHMGALLAMLADPRNRVEATREGDRLIVRAEGPGLLPGCMRATAVADAATLHPASIEMDDGREVVFRNVLTRFRVVGGGPLSL